jgi:GTP cyclohydrolase IA
MRGFVARPLAFVLGCLLLPGELQGAPSCVRDPVGDAIGAHPVTSETEGTLIQDLRKKGVQFRSNDSIAEHVTPETVQQIEDTLTTKFEEIFDALGIDRANDHNTRDSPRRVAKAWVRDLFKGRYEKPPKLTTFPNVNNVKEPIVVGPIPVKSFCAHHMLPIVGNAYVGIMPGKRLAGLSKYSRIVDWFARRPQIQEELTAQIAGFTNAQLKADGVIVRVEAQHFCMFCRGVEHDSTTTTTTALGVFEEPAQRREFLDEVHSRKAR